MTSDTNLEKTFPILTYIVDRLKSEVAKIVNR